MLVGEIDDTTLPCGGITYKNAFDSSRHKFKKRGVVVLDKGRAAKDPMGVIRKVWHQGKGTEEE